MPEVLNKPPKSGIDPRKINEMSLKDEIQRIYKLEEEKLEVAPSIQKGVNFLLNQLDEDRIDKTCKEITEKMKKQVEKAWLGIYIVWERVPLETLNLNLYF